MTAALAGHTPPPTNEEHVINEIRYGVFLRPDPATCWAVTQITQALRQQFGLVSAGAFPPHATLVGNLATRAAEDDLCAALEPVFARTEPFPVYNHGVVADVGYAYDVNSDETGTGLNEPLNLVAAEVARAVAPLSTPVRDHLVTPVEQYHFAGHLGLASHELIVDGGLFVEIGEFIAELPVAPPPTVFDAHWFSLFAFRGDWNGPWWQTMTWRHVRSWDVR